MTHPLKSAKALNHLSFEKRTHRLTKAFERSRNACINTHPHNGWIDHPAYFACHHRMALDGADFHRLQSDAFVLFFAHYPSCRVLPMPTQGHYWQQTTLRR